MSDKLLLKLQEIGAIKFGNFTLKSGISSPLYIDLRETISFPPLLKEITEALWNKISELKFDRICGVPYTAIPFASCLSILHSKPMVMRRKEIKEHGTKKLIEGVFEPGHTCLIVEDLITSGASIFETIAPVEQAGMQVRDIVVFLDREQGGRQRLEEKGYRLHSVATMTQLLRTLNKP
jgi:uridine monophosphate synthetase